MNFRNKYVLAIDQGTTSSRAILFNHQGTIITLAQKPFQQYFPKPGWVEHDPNEIWYTQSSVIKEAMAKADVTDSHIACIGIANQRETNLGPGDWLSRIQRDRMAGSPYGGLLRGT